MGKFKLTIIMAIFVLILAACGSSDDASSEPEVSEPETTETESETSGETEEATEPTTVEITDAHGTVTVPVNPKNVVALDNRTFETLADWGIELAAVPKAVMLADSPYVTDENVQDIGNHREPNLEIIAAADPELVIVGQRFSGYYEDIKKLVPNAAVIDLNVDVEETSTPGESLVNGFKETTLTLGKIFDKNEEAEQLAADLDQSIEKAKSAYNGTDTIMSVIVSGGDVGFSAPHSGRVWGPLYDIFEWTPALEVDDTSTDHQGDEISVEAIAQSNPDWIMVLDRDAPITGIEGEKVPAQDVIDNSPALQNTTAVSEGQIVYAPIDTYLNESIQTFIELFENIADSLAE